MPRPIWDRRKEMLRDLAILTGGEVISDELGKKLEKTTIEDLGRARRVSSTKDRHDDRRGPRHRDAIKARINQIRAQMEETTSDYDREKLQERLAKLSGGVAVVKVGAATEVELKEKKARVEDALQATRARSRRAWCRAAVWRCCGGARARRSAPGPGHAGGRRDLQAGA